MGNVFNVVKGTKSFKWDSIWTLKKRKGKENEREKEKKEKGRKEEYTIDLS